MRTNTLLRFSLHTVLVLFKIKVIPAALRLFRSASYTSSSRDITELKLRFQRHHGPISLIVEKIRVRSRRHVATCKRFKLSISTWSGFISTMERKITETGPQFYITGTITNVTWKAATRTSEHVVSRFAIHRFHIFKLQCNCTFPNTN